MFEIKAVIRATNESIVPIIVVPLFVSHVQIIFETDTGAPLMSFLHVGRAERLVKPIVLDARKRQFSIWVIKGTLHNPFTGGVGATILRTNFRWTFAVSATEWFSLEVVSFLDVLTSPNNHVRCRVCLFHVFRKEVSVIIHVLNVRTSNEGGSVVDRVRPRFIDSKGAVGFALVNHAYRFIIEKIRSHTIRPSDQCFSVRFIANRAFTNSGNRLDLTKRKIDISRLAIFHKRSGDGCISGFNNQICDGSNRVPFGFVLLKVFEELGCPWHLTKKSDTLFIDFQSLVRAEAALGTRHRGGIVSGHGTLKVHGRSMGFVVAVIVVVVVRIITLPLAEGAFRRLFLVIFIRLSSNRSTMGSAERQHSCHNRDFRYLHDCWSVEMER
mmetsp:Transcript_20621/g.39166  ORF Transcript_20621/g.39166 Transcript_20621/m.39166 type:complete len:383 (+) Transcript_20621:1434-2582(+)